jgi:hypothetical protein
MKIEETSELIALQKALNFIKFGEDKEDKHLLSGSPFIGSLLKKVTEELVEYYKKFSPSFTGEWGYIENHPHILIVIKNRINEDKDWRNLTNDVKRSMIKEYCFPYSVKEDTILLLL